MCSDFSEKPEGDGNILSVHRQDGNVAVGGIGNLPL